MSQFDFISQKTEYTEIFDACILAENAKTPSDMASCCRKALTNIVEFIYDKHKVPMQVNATLLELLGINKPVEMSGKSMIKNYK